jgi:hypothetical protein
MNLDRMWEGAFGIKFEALTQHLPAETEGTRQKVQSVYRASELRIQHYRVLITRLQRTVDRSIINWTL